jgi:hypothetical protein
MQLITDVKDEALYAQVMVEQVPFNKWHRWVEKTLNQMALSILFHDKPKKLKKENMPITAVPVTPSPKRSFRSVVSSFSSFKLL